MARILIVDDSPTDVRVLTGMLERAGHQVSSAASAEDGIARARQELPDLILMDVIMPGTNGFQATRTLSRDPDTSHIPVIICTTKNMETDLAGIDPVEAAKYQILIMFLIAGATAIAVLTSGLVIVHFITDDRHRLRLDFLVKSKS